jgi:hypothetical protein
MQTSKIEYNQFIDLLINDILLEARQLNKKLFIFKH